MGKPSIHGHMWHIQKYSVLLIWGIYGRVYAYDGRWDWKLGYSRDILLENYCDIWYIQLHNHEFITSQVWSLTKYWYVCINDKDLTSQSWNCCVEYTCIYHGQWTICRDIGQLVALIVTDLIAVQMGACGFIVHAWNCNYHLTLAAHFKIRHVLKGQVCPPFPSLSIMMDGIDLYIPFQPFFKQQFGRACVDVQPISATKKSSSFHPMFRLPFVVTMCKSHQPDPSESEFHLQGLYQWCALLHLAASRWVLRSSKHGFK